MNLLDTYYEAEVKGVNSSYMYILYVLRKTSMTTSAVTMFEYQIYIIRTNSNILKAITGSNDQLVFATLCEKCKYDYLDFISA